MIEKQHLHCYCCGRTYIRGQFKCCAPPAGMASHYWLEKWCRVEIAPGKNCNSCPRCGCEHRKPAPVDGVGGWSSLAELVPTERTRGNLKHIADQLLK